MKKSKHGKKSALLQSASSSGIAANKTRRIAISLGFVLLALIFAIAFGEAFQPPIKKNNGFGWDGSSYGKMSAQFAAGETVRAQMPFVRRLATPWLAAQAARATAETDDIASEDILRGFKIVNLAAAVAAALLLAAWLAFHLRHWRLAALLGSLYVWHWIAPVRYVIFYPAYADPLFHLSLAASLWAMEWVKKSDYSYLSILSLATAVAAGVAVRESALVAGVAALFCGNPVAAFLAAPRGKKLRAFGRAAPMRLWLPLAAGALVYLLARNAAVATQVADSESVRQVRDGFDYFIEQSASVFMRKGMGVFILGWFYAFGPILAVALFYWRDVRNFLLANERLTVVVLITIAFCLIGGEDNERILHWMSPVFLLALGVAVEKNLAVFLRAPILISFLLASQLIAQRVFWLIPTHPSEFPRVLPLLFTPWSSEFPFLDLYAHYGGLTTQAIALAQYLAFTALICFWLRVRANARETKNA